MATPSAQQRLDASPKMSPAGQLTFDVAALLRRQDANSQITSPPASFGLCELAPTTADDGPAARSAAEVGQFPLSFEFHSFAAASSAAPFSSTGTVAPRFSDANEAADRACGSTTTTHLGAGMVDEAYLEDRSCSSSSASTADHYALMNGPLRAVQATKKIPGPANTGATTTDNVPALPMNTAAATTTATGRTEKPRAEPIRTRNVYVAGLPLGCQDDLVVRLLAPFGAVKSCRVFNSGDNVHDAGHAYAFALFETSAGALAATAALHGLPVEGGRLSCQLSRNGIVKRPRPGAKKSVSSVSHQEALAVPKPQHTAAPVSSAAGIPSRETLLGSSMPPWWSVPSQPPLCYPDAALASAAPAMSGLPIRQHHQQLVQTLPVAAHGLPVHAPLYQAAAAAGGTVPVMVVMPPWSGGCALGGGPSLLLPQQHQPGVSVLHPMFTALPSTLSVQPPPYMPPSSSAAAAGGAQVGTAYNVLSSVQTL